MTEKRTFETVEENVFQFIMWDWKDQINEDELNKAVTSGCGHFKYIETEADYYCLACAPQEFTEEEAQEAFQKEMNNLEECNEAL